MFTLFYEGGPLFMGVLTLELLIAIVVAAMTFTVKGTDVFSNRLGYVKSVGTLALVTGVLGQLIGLYSAFEAISQVGSVSQEMLAAGLKVSSITTIYGLIIFIIAYLLWFGLSGFIKKV